MGQRVPFWPSWGIELLPLSTRESLSELSQDQGFSDSVYIDSIDVFGKFHKNPRNISNTKGLKATIFIILRLFLIPITTWGFLIRTFPKSRN